MADQEPILNLSVYTTIKFSADMLKKITGLSYFYDPNWQANQNGFDASALPFAFIHVIKDEITQVSEVSQKRVILYEENLTIEEAKRKTRQGVLEVVADNIVNMPVTHNIEGIIPTTYLSRTLSGLSSTIADVMSYVYGSVGASTEALDSVNSVLGWTSMLTDYVDKLSKFASTFLPDWSSKYNVDSLLNMQTNRGFIAYKTWEGFGKVKYGIIKNFRTHKEGTEEDYYRFTMEFVEYPVMAIGLQKLKQDTQSKNNKLSDMMNGLVKTVSGFLGGDL